MDKEEQEALENKLIITDAAAELYVKHGEKFTIHQIAGQTNLSVAQILNYFNGKQEILHFYYSSLIIRYRSMIGEIDDFERYTISEKLSNFVYASFDMMAEHRQFVQATFKSFILCSRAKNFKSRLKKLIEDFFKSDELISASSSYLLNDYSYYFLRCKYLMLVLFWLNDESENQEVTIELTDKLTGLLQELVYSSAIDRGVDLVKFMYSNRSFVFNNRFYNKFSSTFKMQ